jgi:hypothetical protein
VFGKDKNYASNGLLAPSPWRRSILVRYNRSTKQIATDIPPSLVTELPPVTVAEATAYPLLAVKSLSFWYGDRAFAHPVS